MKTWRTTGSAPRASSPRQRLSAGTSRQPNTWSSSFSMAAVNSFLAPPPQRRVLREEQHRHAIPAGRGEAEAEPVGLGRKELVGHLQEDAGPVAGRFVGPGGPAVHQVQQHLLAMLDDGMIAAARDIDHRADAAGVVLPLRIVKPSGFGCGKRHRESFAVGLREGTAPRRNRPRRRAPDTILAFHNAGGTYTPIVSLVCLMSIGH